MVARRRDERRPTGRRRLREVAAIATALLVVPIAAILGLKLPLDAAGVLAPIFDLPRTAFGHVRSASEGPVELSGRPADGVAATPGDNQAFAPPRLHRQRPAQVVEPAPVDREPAPANVGATQRPSHETPETSDTPRSGPAHDHGTDNGSGTGSPDDPPGNALDRRGGPAPVDRPSVKPPLDGPSTPLGDDDSAEGPLPPTGDEPVHEPTGPADDQVGGTTDDPGVPPLSGGTGETGGSSDPAAPDGEPETLSTDGGQAAGTGEEAEDEPPESTDQPANDETGPAGDETGAPDETGDPAGDSGTADDSTEADDSGSTADDPPPGLEDEDEGEQPPAGDEGVGDETSGDPADDDQGNTEDDGNGSGHGNGNGHGNGHGNGNGNHEDGCYGSGQGHANGNGNGNCPGQGVANGHDPNHHSGAGQSGVLASPLLLFALAGCTRRVRPRGRRAA